MQIVTNWRSPRQVPAPELESRPTVALEQARAEIRQRVEAQLSKERGMLVITAPPGVGKSTITLEVAEQIARETNTQIAWFGTRHNQFDVVSRSPGWRHVKGRRGDTGNCEMAGIVQAVGNKGWSVSHLLCSHRCPVGRGRCAYWKQWQGDMHRFMPSQHLYAAGLWHRPGLRLVFDELDAQHFVPGPVRIDLNTIGRWRRVWPELADVLIRFIARDTGACP